MLYLFFLLNGDVVIYLFIEIINVSNPLQISKLSQVSGAVKICPLVGVICNAQSKRSDGISAWSFKM
jgi:hypothetical protein